MRMFGNNMGGCGGRTNDCCDMFILFWLLTSCGCGINIDCNTLIILILLLNCCGGHDDCR